MLPGPKDLSNKYARSLLGGPRVQLDLIVVSIRADEGSNNAKSILPPWSQETAMRPKICAYQGRMVSQTMMKGFC